MTPERRQRLLVVLFLAVVLIAGWRLVGSRLGLGGGGGGLGGWSVSGELPETPEGEVVELAELSPETRTYKVERDPFRFGEIPRPKPPPPPPPPKPTPQPTPPPAPVDPGPQLPALTLSYLGKFGPARRPIAVLTDDENNIINAREGDQVTPDFRVRSINLESIDLEYIDFPDEPAHRLAVDS